MKIDFWISCTVYTIYISQEDNTNLESIGDRSKPGNRGGSGNTSTE